MRIGRTIPPVAAPLGPADLWYGLRGWFRPAQALETLEDELTVTFRARHAYLMSSGSAALTVSLKALATLSDRAEVIIPAYTCFSVPAAVVQAGLQPVLCDIDPATFDLDRSQLAGLVNDRTLCVVAHHLFGIPSDIEAVRAICAGHGAFVVEDAAQAMGVQREGRMLGTVGDVGIFSFGRGKHVTCGEGGVIVTNADRIAGALETQYAGVARPGVVPTLASLIKVLVMCVFIRPSLYWIPAGLPFLRLGETIYPTHVPLHRLSGLHAGLMRRVRIRMSRSRRARARTAADLRRRLGFRGSDGGRHPFLRLPIYAATSAEKERLCAGADRRGLGIARGYPTPVSDIPELRSRFDGQRFPHAAHAAEHLVTIPTHHWLSERDKHAIVDHMTGTVGSSCPPEETVVTLEREGA